MTDVCVPQVLGHSSEPSAQSVSPSQAHRRGRQMVLLHWKDEALQVTGGQEASSLASSQSASSSHTKEDDTHWPFLQRNSLFVHCFVTKREGTQRGICGMKYWGHFEQELWILTIKKDESNMAQPMIRNNVPQLSSSAPFSQSALPSQRHVLGTHWLRRSPQLNSVGLHVLATGGEIHNSHH